MGRDANYNIIRNWAEQPVSGAGCGKGRIVERGTHDALYAASAVYHRLHDRQHLVQMHGNQMGAAFETRRL